jgi:itaconate CoA-transferase
MGTTRPLDGILVVAIEQAIAAPYCTRLLADLGARVIKIERPDGGDFARAYDKRARGISSHFVWCNRSKESVALDLKQEKAREALSKLIARADIFLQNLAPGAAARMGFGADELRKRHPKLITCTISGYGENGPWSDKKAYDLLIQAEGGFLSITGTKDEIVKAGVSIVDIAAGVSAYNQILAALLLRAKTFEGSHIDVSMLEAMVEWMGFPLYYALDGASPPARNAASHSTIYPYGPFETKDGEVLFGLQNDREWADFASTVLERPELAKDKRFSGSDGRMKEKPFLAPIIASTLKALSTTDATARLDRAGIANGRVNELKAVWEHAQLKARRRWAEVQTPAGGMPALLPTGIDSFSPRMDAVPALGEHTEAVLREFGMADSEIRAMKSA